MEAQEIRIGNLVEHSGFVEVIDGIQPKWVWFKPYASTPLEFIRAIRLTEEWLLKFGFAVKSHYAVGVGSYYTYDFGKLSLLKNVKGEFYFPALPFSTVIHSVHQLQNLYFSLIGEELEIKSPNVAGNP